MFNNNILIEIKKGKSQMNYVVYVDKIGFFESMGHNGITYTNEIVKAFQMGKWSAKDIVKTIGKDCCILKVSD